MLSKTFCSSPWFHIRIDPAGNYLPCRWSNDHATTGHNIKTTTIREYMNSNEMKKIRMSMLNGEKLPMCQSCYYEDDNKKVSGRAKQLLKSAINIEDFNNSFCASPQFNWFNKSDSANGYTSHMPVDLQIDLGNTCNSACIMCTPTYSSRLETEYIKLNKIQPELFAKYPKSKNWSDDTALVDKFIGELKEIPNIRYIHFLGGETLYLRSFYTVCKRLIDAGLAKSISMGTTTNCTVFTPELETIIAGFKEVHLGLSIESLHSVNDYVRYPSNINNVVENINKFILLRDQTNLHLSLRITPSILTIYNIDTIFDFMIANGITAESCNILSEPSCLRIELLPCTMLQKVLDRIDAVINKHNLIPVGNIVNRRDHNKKDNVISNIIFEYKNLIEDFLDNYTKRVPYNIEQERYNLVKFLKAFDSTRSNNILEHLPDYEEFLRRYGYKKRLTN